MVPSARFELMQHILEISNWNSIHSAIRKDGASGFLEFLFDQYQLDDDVSSAVGKLIFEDELQSLEKFISNLDWFVGEWLQGQSDLDDLYKAVIPESVEDSAKQLYNKLMERGAPVYIADNDDSS